ncbi:MAG TPA: hypothetical protein EYO33_06165 [Phycisphaerales bacterium]|nr:hypothetical protein [Phycisphaerales bacterium]
MLSQRRKLGASLATVMMVVAMMMTLAFTVVAIAFNHLNLSFKNSNNSKAKHLAEATLARAVDSIYKDQDFGRFGTASEKTVRVSLDSLPAGSEGVLTFDESTATAEGVPVSTNNRTEGSVYGGGNRLVPGESFHLVAKGKVKNSFCTVEAIITVPKFPFSVAAEGQIKSTGGLVVASVRSNVQYDLNYPIHEDDLQPGHLVSNSKAGDSAVVLSGENKIYGDLQSSSGVTIENDTSVLGEIRTDAQKEVLPQTRASDYDPEGKPGMQTVNSGAGKLEIQGYNKSYGDLTVDNGVYLDGGVLYVDGDLTVSAGGVSGRGALVSTGNITIFGDGEAKSDNQAAIVADGNISLQGSSAEKASFAGLIYTRGNLKAEYLRLAGVFVAAGDSSDVEFKDTEVYEDVSKAVIDIDSQVSFEIPTNIEPDATTAYGYPIEVQADMSQLQSNIENYRNPNTGPSEPDYLFKFAYAGSSTGYGKMVPGNPIPQETTGPDPFVIDGSSVGMKMFGQPVNSVAEAESVALANIEAQMLADGKTVTAVERDTIKSEARRVYLMSTPGYWISKAAADYTGGGSNPSDPSTTPFEFSLDLSEFYNKHSDRMQVLYWADWTELVDG